MRRSLPALTSVWLLFACSAADSAENSALLRALNSITSTELAKHADTLADDTFEGREAGSRGGRAASVYIAREFARLGVEAGGHRGTWFQPFDGGKRNVLGLIEGGDPKLKRQYIIISAHYDHVGYGSPQNSYGPFGRIHNGADDNASGVAGLLEVAEAFAAAGVAPRRSILLAAWDGEEQGLLGSSHWVDHPTVPLGSISLVLNMDMIGRLRDGRVVVYGTRTGWGLRRLVCESLDSSELWLDFKWNMQENSDHWTFYQRSIPVLMLHTGLHDDYHRPRDDAHKLNREGMQQVAQLMFRLALAAADRDRRTGFRRASRSESPSDRRRLEAPLTPLPPRLGVWSRPNGSGGGLLIERVQADSPADRAGLRVGDRLLALAGKKLTTVDDLRAGVAVAESPAVCKVLRSGKEKPELLEIALAGKPVRVGINWREDEAEPGTVVLSRVVSGSPADRAGLSAGDRIYQVGGRTFSGSEEFRQLVTTLPGPLELRVERRGRIREVALDVPAIDEGDAPQ